MNTKKILALDIGGSKMMAGIADIIEFPAPQCVFNQVVKKKIVPGFSQEQLLLEIRSLLIELGPLEECEAIGANIPGLADPKLGRWVFAPFSGIRDVPISQVLSDWTGGKPTFIENDVNACAYAEKLFGICQNINDFLWITISNGIGGGWVLGGDIFRGHFGNAGEIGHLIVVDENGAACGCGNYGCLEAEAAGPGISRRYKERSRNDAFSSAEEIAQLARNGAPIAQAVFETTGRLLGKAIAAAVNLINPEKIVIGGGVSGAFDLFYPELLNSFQRYSFQAASKGLSIEKTGLGYEAALCGAAAIGLRGLNNTRLDNQRTG